MDIDGDGIIDNYSNIETGQQIMIQSFISDKYLQLCEEIPDGQCSEQGQFQYSENQQQILAGGFTKKNKNGMIFIIEEVHHDESIYTYQGSCVFDEMLEFYSFLNIFAVKKCE